MPIMPLETDHPGSSPPNYSLRDVHPDPLRSHSPDPDYLPYFTHHRSTSQLLNEEGSTPTSPTKASALDPAEANYRHRRADRQHHLPFENGRRDVIERTHLKPAIKEGLGHCAMAAAFRGTNATDAKYGDAPVIPPRHPLREKPNLVSRFSFYSDSTLPTEPIESTLAALTGSDMSKTSASTITSHRKAFACLAILSILSFSNGLSTTFLASALPTIAQEFESTAVASFWLVISFLISRTLAQPLCSRLAEAIGPNPIILIGCFAYGLGSVISGASTTIAAVFVGRCIEGLGIGAITIATPMVFETMNSVLDQASSAKAVAVSHWLAAALGPILGAGMASTVGWQDFFYVTAAIGCGSVMALPFVLVPPSDEDSQTVSVGSIDYPGWLLTSGSLLSILIALTWAGSQYDWSSSQVVGPLIIGLIALVVSVVHGFYHDGASLPVAVLKDLTTLRECGSALVLGIIYMAIIHFLPLYLLAIKGTSPMVAASPLASWTLSTFVASFVTAAFPVLLHSTWTISLAWAALFISTGLLIALDLHTAVAVCVPFGLLAGCAIGTLQICMLKSTIVPSDILGETTRSKLYARSEMITFFHSFGHTLGIVLGACIFLNVLRNALTPHGHALDFSATVTTMDAVHLLGTVDPSDRAMLRACTAALDGVWILCCTLAASFFIISAASAAEMLRRGKHSAISV